MTVLRVLMAIVIAGLLSACSVDTSRYDFALDSEALAAETAAYDESEYCAALGVALAMTPEGETTSAEFDAFADALDEAAAVAKLEHRSTLGAMADANRNPETLTAGAAFSLMNRSMSIHRFAHEACDITAPGVTVNEDGSVSFGLSYSSSSSVTIDEAVSTDSDDSVPLLAAGPGSSAPLDFSGSPTQRLDRLNGALADLSDVVFESTLVETDDDGGYDALVPIPVGWSIETGSFSAEAVGSDSDLVMEFDSSCQGFCTPQDWEAEVMQDPEWSPFTLWSWDEVELLLLQDLESPSGRLMVVEHDREVFGRKVEIVLARWDDGADHFFECSVQLPEDSAQLWPQFAQACALGEPVWFP